jgi:hypothetical protein
MSIASVLKSVVAPDNDDAAVAQAFEVATAKQQVVVTVHKNVERNAAAVSALKQQIADAALIKETGGSDAALKKLRAQIETAEGDLEDSEAALVAAQRNAATAERALTVARGQGDFDRIKRMIGERHKRALAFAAAAEVYVKASLSLMKANGNISNVLASTGGAPAGHMLTDIEVDREAGYELARLAPRDSLDPTSRAPGSVFDSYHNSFTEPSFISKCDQADAHILKLMQP